LLLFCTAAAQTSKLQRGFGNTEAGGLFHCGNHFSGSIHGLYVNDCAAATAQRMGMRGGVAVKALVTIYHTQGANHARILQLVQVPINGS
jgi:hypothetical protein